MQLSTRLLLSSAIALSVSAQADTGNTWAIRVLPLQHQVDTQAPLSDTHWLGTHNSFGNPNDDSAIDYNQPHSIMDQLNKGARQIGFDVHYGSDLLGDMEVRLCHNNVTSTGYAECGSGLGDRQLKYGLEDITQWLSQGHQDQVVILRLELAKSAESNINKVESVIGSKLGALIYRPDAVSYHGNQGGAYGCTGISPALTKADVIKAGKNIILLSPDGCQSDGGFHNLVFVESASGNGKVNTPGEITQSGKIYRAFDSHTRYSILNPDSDTYPQRMRPSNLKDWFSAGHNIFELYGYAASGTGWDKGAEPVIQPHNMVWSWQEGQPYENNASQNCAMVGSSGRMSDEDCSTYNAVACRTGDGQWKIPAIAVRFNEAANLCATAGASFAVPRNVPELNALIAVKNLAVQSQVWVSLHDQNIEGIWQANATLKGHSYIYSGGYGSSSGGSPFNDTPEVARDLHSDSYRSVKKVFLRSGERLDQVGLVYSDSRAVTHGGTGGGYKEMALAVGERITGFKVCANSESGTSYRVYYLKLWTNLGGAVEGGKASGSCYAHNFPTNHGLVGFTGRSGGAVDRLGFITRAL